MGELVPFDDCPEGLFLFNGTLCFMSEYATVTSDGVRQRDAYVVSSGEYFWGGTSSPIARAALMVAPIADPTAEIEKLRRERDHHSALREQYLAEATEMREALKPFADFAEQAERFVDARAKFGGTSIFPTKHFKLEHFRRARALSDGGAQ